MAALLFMGNGRKIAVNRWWLNSGGAAFEALSGETSFPLTDSSDIKGIPGENLNKELYLTWQVPAKGNLKLLVFIHGWASGGQNNPGTAVLDYLFENNIAYISIGMRGRNTGVDYANYSSEPNTGDVEKYRDASGAEIFDIVATTEYFRQYVAAENQIDINKIWLYGISGGGGNSIAAIAKYPNYFAGVVDWFGMSKYAAYPGDPNIAFEGWGRTNLAYQALINYSTGASGINFIGYTAGDIGDAVILGRDHLRALADFKGKIHIYHYTGDGYVSIDHSDELEDVLIANSQDYEYHRSTNSALYDHGKFDIDETYFDSVTPYGLHWVADMASISRVPSLSSGTAFVAGFKVFDDWEIWNKRYRKNTNHVSAPYGGRYNQGRIGACTVTYNLDTNEFTLTPVYPTTPLEPYSFINIVRDGVSMDYLVASGDTITVSPIALNKKPASLDYAWKWFHDLSDSDGVVIDDAGNVSNILDLTGNGYLAWQNTRATRKALSGGGLLNPIYLLRGTSGTLANNVNQATLTGAFTLVVKVNATDVTAGYNKKILGRGTDSLWIEDRFSGKTQIKISIDATTISNGTSHSNTEIGTGLMVIGIRRTSGGDIYMYSKSAAGLFAYGNRGNNAGVFDVGSIGGVSTTNVFAGTIYRTTGVEADIGDTDMQTLLNAWYAA